MSVDSCGTCRFWEVTHEDSGQGVCRCHPPVSLVDKNYPEGYSTFWPTAFENEWCGEFEGLPVEPELAHLGREERSSRLRRYRGPNPNEPGQGGWT